MVRTNKTDSTIESVESADWYVKAGRYEAQIVAESQIDGHLRALLADLRVPNGSTMPGIIEVLANGSGSYVLRSNGRVWAYSVPKENIGDEMVRMILLAALDAEPTLVHVHAGAVANRDGTAIIAGIPGSGKSTAIVTLLSSGFSYLTDERLVLSPDGLRVAGFPKPISLVWGSRQMFTHLDPRRTSIGTTSREAWQIPASSIGRCSPQKFTAPSLVIFISYKANAPLRTTLVEPLDAAARLMTDSPDVISRGHAGAHAIVSLTASVPCIELEYSNAADLVSTTNALLADLPTIRDHEPVVLQGDTPHGRPAPDSPDEIQPNESFAILDSISTWVIDDRALAYNHVNGHIVEVDALSTVWLQLIDETVSLSALIDEVATATNTDATAVRRTALHVVHSLWISGVVGPTVHDELSPT